MGVSTKEINQTADSERDKKFKRKATVFLAGVGGASVLFGFGSALALSKKRDPEFFGKGLVPTHTLSETGASIALRALGWGSLLAVSGCSIIFYGIWKVVGASNISEFRSKVGSMLPSIPKNNPPHGRTEFSGLNDLLQYIIDEDNKKKQDKLREDTSSESS
ncbi:transmembrane protein 242-like [Artemia franciscana]|uniref:Transmembrane protein 242 n=1 Tax=Artemia franciscana TaxID=6661 RepID=A0AA88KR01_ARTSF|nr:hypothetical protein QYM36_019372 [Artemia franciscana]KAK2701983.1 hypothetical protein QYM36_019372 [Artemia franciscana]